MLVVKPHNPLPIARNALSSVVSVVQHRKIAVSFRDLSLLSVFKVALVALRQLLDNRADAKLKEQVCILGG